MRPTICVISGDRTGGVRPRIRLVVATSCGRPMSISSIADEIREGYNRLLDDMSGQMS